ncbi:MAG: hypothetical protein IJ727_05915 [Treponema sp.]|nr:hypothetical protein [Treponema sp.]
MRDFAIVKKVDGQQVEVVSLISNACVICNSIDCAKRGKSFYVQNKKKLSLEENSIVRIGFSPVLNGILGVISFLFPIVCSVLGWLFSPELCARFGLVLSPRSSACFVGIFFIAATLLVVLISRTNIHLTRPEIIQVM